MRRQNYRRTLAAAAMVTASLALGACGGAAGGGDDNTLTVWHNATTGDGAAYWQQMADDFMASHEGVTIEVQAIQNEDLDGKLQTAQNAGEGPDVFLARGGGKLADMVEAGFVLDISDKLDENVSSSVPEGAFAAYTIDDGVYAMPTSFQPGGIFYSQDLFDAAGITEAPTTMDELGTAVEALKGTGVAPIALGGKDAWPAAHWYYFFALRECSHETLTTGLSTYDFSDQCWLDAGQDLADLAASKPFNDGFLTTSAQQGAGSSAGLLANHQAAMELMGTWNVGVVGSLTPDEEPLPDLRWFTFPEVEGGKGDPSALMGGVDGYACSSTAPESLCVEFLNFIMSEENQEAYADAFDTIPVNMNAQDVVTDEALLPQIEANNRAAYTQVWLDTSLGSNIGNALNVAVVDLLAGQGDAQGIIDAMTSAAAKE
ncbi:MULTISPECIES: extracellular solute-binding protein [unclassified Actinomyces]|uniref:ABC transporter substrate-binding protein n=1 Tax=unclassified Actinomyces TaxID=2609248 RepID=UPI0020177F73|nr:MULTISPECIES: extracellular solute-binding protein [unclassified Actinomyces]MCL3777153.1 extracellular solute-binding protein [Actinomyces sp. AC-20-1]MCL3789023.1 extracellular solute-binding protein [Actinomyces sp. 187325]MCL3791378.1 extracellular solute-binding protein [Actinomyces sp. 186855]MCL3793911.1 extracellular solute-binding protein [Actinomyces sp. 217892]